jgi:hypothetical protein
VTKAERIKALLERKNNPVKEEKILTAASDEALKTLEEHADKLDRIEQVEKKAEEEAAAKKQKDEEELAAAAKRKAKSKDDEEEEDEDEDEDEDDKKKKYAERAPQTEAEWLEIAPPAIRDMVSRHKQADAEAKSVLVAALKKTQNVLTEAQLKERSLEQLQEIAKLTKIGVPDVNYAGRAPRAAEEFDDYLRQTPPDGYKIALEKRKSN